MWKVLVLLCLAASPTLSVSDRRCGTNANKLWLDVVFVIDNCKIGSMNLVYQTISSLFSKQLQIGTGYDDPRSTRVGFITYNWNATDVADFYKLQSWADLNSQIQRLQYTPQSSSPASRMDTGLNAAIGMIDATAGFRDNYKKIVIVFTSVHGSYKSNQPRDVSKILKSRGIPVVTVNTGSSSDTQAYLKQIASDNMSFAIADGNVTQEILKAMTDTNCFCEQGWVQYNYPWNNLQNRYGTCLYTDTTDYSSRDGAKSKCRQYSPKSYLVNELDQQKRDFNFNLVNSDSTKPVNAFYNGLLNLNGNWYWDQPNDRSPIPLDPNSGAPPTRNACVADMKYSDGTTAWTPVSCANNFRFICEQVACDTDNYCDGV
ncbi:C-type lectin domain-containing protein [Caenorhabditis elegans]|uniref:C-type lectin domain-containing protein n=1 Tax=Caenorhabditis elegans TaxID=6239 RepID=O45443_CAEEL|nr:C-type lectin domain-containing protein [Caenorhabditis elegans]CAB03057.1 C-type lectin domain-containing protein [Caenorhabditis elegans]|eukprot:NP_496745.1 C-type LECtin [Caenorhabditis elegans]